MVVFSLFLAAGLGCAVCVWFSLKNRNRSSCPMVPIRSVRRPERCACGNNAKRGTNPPTCGRCRRQAEDFAAGRTCTSVHGTLAG
jgi:hypothetical protein